MVEFASGSRLETRYVLEVVPGETPVTPAMQVFRTNAPSLNPVRPTIRSEEITPDRQTISLLLGQRSAAGNYPSELQLANHDDWLESAMSGTWDDTVANSTPIGVTAPDQIVCSGGTLVTDDFRPGDVVELGSLVETGEEGQYVVSAMVADGTAMTVVNLDGTPAVLTTEAESATPTLALVGSRVDIGVLKRTFTIEQAWLDINYFDVFLGIAINGMTIDATPDAIPTVSYDLLGMNFTPATQTPLEASPTAAPTNKAMSPFTGKIFEGTSSISYVTALNVVLNNNRELVGVIGTDVSPTISEGDATITGTLTLLFPDADHANKFANETASSVWFRLVDPVDPTQFIQIVIPNLLYTAPDKTVARTGPVTMALTFEGLKDPITGTAYSIQRSNA